MNRPLLYFFLVFVLKSYSMEIEGLQKKLEEQQQKLAELQSALQPPAPKTREAKIERWKQIAIDHKTSAYPARGYVYYNDKSIFKGKRVHSTLKKLVAAKESDKIKIKKMLANEYKIHLMPDDNQIEDTVVKLLEEIIKKPELQSLIKEFKVQIMFEKDPEHYKTAESIFPRIVIYPSSGKRNAQKLLNVIYDLFKDSHGLDIAPRHNAKVTDFIYVAQGDATYKGSEYDKFYELPLKIYYDKNQIPPDDSDHYLLHPKTNEPLTK